MTDSQLWLKGADIATIVTWIMAIGALVLLRISKQNSKKHKPSHRSSKK